MTTFALERLEEFDDDEDAELRVCALTQNGRNEWQRQINKLRKDGKRKEIDRLYRHLEDLRWGKKLPVKTFKPLGTRSSTGKPVHEGEYELVVGKLRGYCVLEGKCLIVLFSVHTKKGTGGSQNTDQTEHILALREKLKILDCPLSELLTGDT